MEAQRGLESGVEKLEITPTTNSSVQFFDEFQYFLRNTYRDFGKEFEPLTLTRFGVNTIDLSGYSDGKCEIMINVTAKECKQPTERGLKVVHQFKATDDRKIEEEEWILLPYEFTHEGYRYWKLQIPFGAVKMDISFVESDMAYKDGLEDEYGYYLVTSKGLWQGS